MSRYNFDRVSGEYDQTRRFPPGVSERIAIPFIEAGVRYTGFDISEQMMARLTEKLGKTCGGRSCSIRIFTSRSRWSPRARMRSLPFTSSIWWMWSRRSPRHAGC